MQSASLFSIVLLPRGAADGWTAIVRADVDADHRSGVGVRVASTPHFSKRYREYFGIPQCDELVGSNNSQQVAMITIPQSVVLAPLSGPLLALSQALDE